MDQRERDVRNRTNTVQWTDRWTREREREMLETEPTLFTGQTDGPERERDVRNRTNTVQ